MNLSRHLYEKQEIKYGQLFCYRWNYNSSSLESVSHKAMRVIVFACSMGTLSKVASLLLFDLTEVLSDLQLKVIRLLKNLSRNFKLNSTNISNINRLGNSVGLIAHPIQVLYINPQSYNDLFDFILVRWFDSLYEVLNYIKGSDSPNK